MSVVGVLGASGETGRLVTGLLAEHAGVPLVLLGRRAEALEHLRAGLPDPARAEVRAADATRPEEFAAALRGVDVVVVTAPVLDRLEGVLSTALAAGTDWIDVLLDGPGKWDVLDRLGPAVAAAGRCVVTGAGMHPGLAAVLVRAVATRFDVLTRARVAQVIAADWNSYAFSPEAMTEFTRELTAFEVSGLVDGAWRKLPWWRATTVDFGAPFGRRACAPMGLEEMRRLPECQPGLRDAALVMAGLNPVTDWLVMPVAMGMALLSPRLTGPAARLLVASLRRFGAPPYGSLAQVVGEGTGRACRCGTAATG